MALSRDKKKALFGECKWRNKPINGEKLLEELKKKVELSNWRSESYYFIICKKVKNVPDELILLDENAILQILRMINCF